MISQRVGRLVLFYCLGGWIFLGWIFFPTPPHKYKMDHPLGLVGEINIYNLMSIVGHEDALTWLKKRLLDVAEHREEYGEIFNGM